MNICSHKGHYLQLSRQARMSAAVYVLSTVTGYVLTSALLLRCPSLLHRRKRETFRSRHISHRGGAGENLENTMEAFKQ
ncbi:hypothetical protein DNTS_021570 [Danionella cerebrum]|uniref:GP-PDE domain-containing protein n=1 Tax=Danionella cerebrum TaxID=2873325 RepID=A0A553QXH8_9TELE|nr:hypothetical protein DNTS_021570 [Danionella translucida]